MSEIDQLPEPWRTLMEGKVSSQNDLARKAEISTATVNRAVKGQGTASAETVQAIADVLTGGDPNPIWEALSATQRNYGAFPIASIEHELDLLTSTQRVALIDLVRSMAYPDRKGGGEHGGSRGSAPTKPGPSGPGSEDGDGAGGGEVIDFPQPEPDPEPKAPREVPRASRKDSPRSKAKQAERDRLKGVGAESQDPDDGGGA